MAKHWLGGSSEQTPKSDPVPGSAGPRIGADWLPDSWPHTPPLPYLGAGRHQSVAFSDSPTQILPRITDADSVGDVVGASNEQDQTEQEPPESGDGAATEGGKAAPRTSKQVAWNYGVFALSKSSTLIMTVVVARLLAPAEFGLFALALLIVNLFDYVKDLGVGAALVQSRRDWKQIAPTGLVVSAGFGLVAAGVMAASAPWSAELLGHKDLTALVQVLAIGLAISSLSAVPAAWLRRELNFSSRLLPEFAGALSKTIVTIALAATGFGVWSLAYGQLVATILTTTLYWIVAKAPTRIGFDSAEARRLTKYGIPVTALTLLAFGIYNVDYLSIGSRLGTTELGLYTLAYRLPELLVLNLCSVISEVLFSSLSRLQHDSAKLIAHYRQALSAVVVLTAPVGAGLAVISAPLIDLLYGHAYAPAAPMLTLLAVYTVVYSASFHAGDVFKAIGRPGILTAINAGKLAVLIGPIWYAAGKGAVWVAVALLSVEVMHFVVRMFILHRVVGVGARDLIEAILPAIAAVAPMAAAMWLVYTVVHGIPDILQLIAMGVVALLVYGMTLRVMSPTLFELGLRIFKRFVLRRQSVVSES